MQKNGFQYNRIFAWIVQLGGVLSVFVVLSVSCPAMSAEQHLSPEILSTEAIPAWKRLAEQSWKDACITWTTIRKENLSHKEPKTNTYRYVLNTLGDMFSLETSAPKSRHTGSNFVIQNKDYAFEVGQVMKEDEWTLNYWGNPDSHAIQTPLETDIATLKSPWTIYTAIPMSEIVTDPSFAVKKLILQEEGIVKRIVLKFSLNSERGGNIAEIKEGEISFDPARCWAIQEYHMTLQRHKDSSFQVKMNVQYDHSEIPVMTRLEYSLIIKSGTITWTSEIESRKPCKLKEKDFRLPAFGLPELGSPSYILQRILFALGWIVLLGIVYWLWKTRKTEKESP